MESQASKIVSVRDEDEDGEDRLKREYEKRQLICGLSIELLKNRPRNLSDSKVVVREIGKEEQDEEEEEKEEEFELKVCL